VIFEKADSTQGGKTGYTGVSLVVHALFIVLVLAAGSIQRRADIERAVEVKFVSKAPGPPPPPAAPPPPKKHPRRPPTRIAKIEIPKVLPPSKPVEEEADEDEGVEGGVEGGVAGGVVGGVVGTAAPVETAAPPPPPPAPEKPKAKNVPPFVIARDAIRQPNPRMSEIFKQTHRGQTVTGMYKVCVGQDGHVYEVTAIKEVPGADEEIVSTIREEWLYKEQQVPVCFMYAFNISIVQ
jgi:protein TonB